MSETKSDIFVLDRPCDLTTAILWHAATSKEVKFDTISKTTTLKEAADGVFEFEDKINKCIDVLCGIRFSLPVRDFQLHVKYPDGVGRAIINLAPYDFGVKRIVFDEPIPMCRYPYLDFTMTYTFESGVDIDGCFDNSTIYTQYSFLNPIFECMVLSNENIEKAKSAPSRFEFSPRIFDDQEIGLLPSAILSP